MKIYTVPPAGGWASVLQRPALDVSALEKPVGQILQEVQQRGDDALLDFTARFDGVRLADFRVPTAAVSIAGEVLSPALKKAIHTAAANIRSFHAAQQTPPTIIETMPGVRCWRESVGIEKVGLYIPGGTAPLFSTVLMLAIPAQLAGCKEIILCTPPDKNGQIHPAILYAASVAGVSQIFSVGGAQAIAAMAYGTDTIPAVYKIFGYGNAYVTVAKQLVSRIGVAIDMPAGYRK
ncbi:MAG: histidinol dehydrogenase [Saprospiraceae bacterium]